MKKKVLALALVFCLMFSQVAVAAGIPVIDSSNLMQSIENSIMEIMKMVEQITVMKQQYDQMQQTYKNMTGGRGLGSIMSDQANKDYLPDDWKSVFDKISSGGMQGLSSSGSSVRNSNKIFDICAGMKDVEKRACERQVALAAQNKANAAGAFDKAKARMQQIESLMRQIDSSSDQKEILELNGRIQAENAMIQNEAIKMQLYQQVAEGERKLAEQQQREVEVQKFSRRGGVKVEPIDFGGMK